MQKTSVWQELTHEKILAAVEKTLHEPISNLLLQRNSYINRVYELEKLDPIERFILKFYRPGRWTQEMILEEHKFLFDLLAKEIPVISPLKIKDKTLFSLSDHKHIHYALFPKKGGRALDEFDRECWEELGRLLSRIHLVGATRKSSKRVAWRPKTATKHHLNVLLKTDYLLSDFEKPFQQAAEEFIKMADPLFDGHEFILLHGDCHKGNLIHRPGEGIYIVDFDDMCFGPPVQDIWMLLPGSVDKCENELEWFLQGYETFRPFDRRSLSLVPLLRGMRLIHFASWLAVQSNEPDFLTHFPHAGSAKYWNELIREIHGIYSSDRPS